MHTFIFTSAKNRPCPLSHFHTNGFILFHTLTHKTGKKRERLGFHYTNTDNFWQLVEKHYFQWLGKKAAENRSILFLMAFLAAENKVM
jgi:hypothetical protein